MDPLLEKMDPNSHDRCTFCHFVKCKPQISKSYGPKFLTYSPQYYLKVQYLLWSPLNWIVDCFFLQEKKLRQGEEEIVERVII